VQIRARLRVLIAIATLCLAGGVSAGQGGVPPAAGAHSPGAQVPRAQRPAPIDINSASLAQLKTLPWIGDAEAARIIKGRPYLSKAGLVTKKVLPAGIYQSIRHRITAIQPTPSGHPAALPDKPADSRV